MEIKIPERPSVGVAVRRLSGGFSLIEIMITLAVIAILAAVALPSYSTYIQRSARADARSVLLQASQFMQRFYAMHNAYDVTAANVSVALPAALMQSPASGAARFRISLANVDGVGYTLQAVPEGASATDPCGTLTLTSTGVRGASGAATAQALADCWR